MARTPAPVRPRVADAKAYERQLRRHILTPLFRHLRTGLADAAALNQVWRAMDASIAATSVRGIPIREIRKALTKIDSYHRARLIRSFRSALGADIRPFLTRGGIQAMLNQRIAENVALVKTIGPRFHQGLTAAIQREFADKPFDAQRLSGLLREEYSSSGYNLRRLTRDQNNKLIGQLTQARHQQMGIQGYRWQTVGDERVRQSHQDNNGQFFRWDDPPATGHPGQAVQCRCLAIAALLKADRDRLAQTGTEPPVPPPTPEPPMPPPIRPTPPAPLPIPPAPRPAPPSSFSQIDEVAKKDATARTRIEADWHESSWGGNLEGVAAQAAGRTREVFRVSREARPGRAYYRPVERDIDMDGHGASSRQAQAIWRHEFGHHMDFLTGTPSRAGSYSKAFQSARRADLKRLQNASGKEAFDMKGTATRGHQRSAEFSRLPTQDRARALKDLSAKTGLDEDEVRALLKREGPLEHMSWADGDALVHRFMTAYDELDAQGMIDILLWEGQASMINAGRSQAFIHSTMMNDKGVGILLSDLADGATLSRAAGSFGHSKSYYRFTGNRETEIFANVVGVSGESELAARMVERLFPGLYREVTDLLETIK